MYEWSVRMIRTNVSLWFADIRVGIGVQLLVRGQVYLKKKRKKKSVRKVHPLQTSALI